jgi:hypothetical protein
MTPVFDPDRPTAHLEHETPRARKKQPKVQAGGVLREALACDWRTPERILERVRAYFGGPIPFDPCTGPENPTRALRFCTGGIEAPASASVPSLFPDAEAPTAREQAGLALARASGLATSWAWPTWCNPPFGEELRDWLAKVRREAARGCEVVLLLPCSRWETDYFQELWTAAVAVCFIRRRVDFISAIDGQPVKGNPYASMLLGFNVSPARWREAFEPLGACSRIEVLRGC